MGPLERSFRCRKQFNCPLEWRLYSNPARRTLQGFFQGQTRHIVNWLCIRRRRARSSTQSIIAPKVLRHDLTLSTAGKNASLGAGVSASAFAHKRLLLLWIFSVADSSWQENERANLHQLPSRGW